MRCLPLWTEDPRHAGEDDVFFELKLATEMFVISWFLTQQWLFNLFYVSEQRTRGNSMRKMELCICDTMHDSEGKFRPRQFWANHSLSAGFIIMRTSRYLVLHSLRKNGEVTKSHYHTISIFSWQGCAQFGFKSKRSTLQEFPEMSNVSLTKRTPRHVVWLISTAYANWCRFSCLTINLNGLCKYVSVSKTSCCTLAPLRLILICPVFCE